MLPLLGYSSIDYFVYALRRACMIHWRVFLVYCSCVFEAPVCHLLLKYCRHQAVLKVTKALYETEDFCQNEQPT